MNSKSLVALLRLLDAARLAETARLGAVLAEAARCRDRGALLKGQISAAGDRFLPPAVPESRQHSVPEAAASLSVASRWIQQLAHKARDEEARARAFEIEAEAIRPRVARAFGRCTAAGAMARKVHMEERRLAQNRAEAAIIPPRPAPDQPVSSDSVSSGTSTGSPGIE